MPLPPITDYLIATDRRTAYGVPIWELPLERIPDLPSRFLTRKALLGHVTPFNPDLIPLGESVETPRYLSPKVIDLFDTVEKFALLPREAFCEKILFKENTLRKNERGRCNFTWLLESDRLDILPNTQDVRNLFSLLLLKSSSWDSHSERFRLKPHTLPPHLKDFLLDLIRQRVTANPLYPFLTRTVFPDDPYHDFPYPHPTGIDIASIPKRLLTAANLLGKTPAIYKEPGCGPSSTYLDVLLKTHADIRHIPPANLTLPLLKTYDHSLAKPCGVPLISCYLMGNQARLLPVTRATISSLRSYLATVFTNPKVDQAHNQARHATKHETIRTFLCHPQRNAPPQFLKLFLVDDQHPTGIAGIMDSLGMSEYILVYLVWKTRPALCPGYPSAGKVAEIKLVTRNWESTVHMILDYTPSHLQIYLSLPAIDGLIFREMKPLLPARKKR